MQVHVGDANRVGNVFTVFIISFCDTALAEEDCDARGGGLERGGDVRAPVCAIEAWRKNRCTSSESTRHIAISPTNGIVEARFVVHGSHGRICMMMLMLYRRRVGEI
jgi:hypothetical protein